MNFTLLKTCIAASIAMSCNLASAADVCGLLSRNDAINAIGVPVSDGTPGATRDPDSGGDLSYCTYKTETAALLVTVVEFSSADEARKQFAARLNKQAAGTKMAEEPNIGEQAFWGVSSSGSAYTFVKANKVVGVGIGGPGIAEPASRKNSLRDLAAALAGKV